MNVLQVANTLHQGGAEAHLLQLAKGLKGHGVTCEVAFLRSHVTGGSYDLRQIFEDAGVRTHYLNCERSYDLRVGIRLKRLLATRQWDVLHSHLPRCDAASAFCKLLQPSQTWISTLHHPYNSDDNAYSAGRWIQVLAPLWRLADGVIAVSEPVRQWSIDMLRIEPERTHTIAHGINIEDYGDATPRPEVGSQSGPLRHSIGAIGRYEERKGHETLIRAMVPILKQVPDAELRIAGHDPWGHGNVLRELIRELHLDDHVTLLGFMSDKHAFFADIDVFAFASRSEGFGIVLLEAMAASKATVVSNISPLNEIICPGKSGLVAERDDVTGFADAIISLFRDPNYLTSIAGEGRQRVATEFSEARMVERTLRYYRDVVSRVDNRPPEGAQCA
jgi:glycosyltransferase involved in cell wall biosynthesis